MSLNVTQALAGQQAIRPPVTSEALAPPRPPAPSPVAPVGGAESSAQASSGRAGSGGADNGLTPGVSVEALDRAIDEANSLVTSRMRAQNRSIEFGRDNTSGRITITISEEVNGEVVQRQIPPPAFLRMVEQLRSINGGESPRGALVDLDI